MPETKLTYRIATPDDVPALVAFIGSAYRGESSRAGWTTEADLLEGVRIDAAGIQAKMAAPSAAILLAHDDAGALTACCELAKRSNVGLAYFGLFAVDPARQAGGIGRQVLAEAEAYAKRELGAARLEMHVIWTRGELISWYERRGYTKLEGTRPFPYAELVDGGRPLRDDLAFAVLVKDL